MATISVFPRSTEKAYGLSKNNIYVFETPVDANKQQIIDAVQSQFGVSVVNIKTMIQKGKAVRANRGRRARPGIALRSDTKKAYVTLAEGDSIKVFDETAPETTEKTTPLSTKKEDRPSKLAPSEQGVKPKFRIRKVLEGK